MQSLRDDVPSPGGQHVGGVPGAARQKLSGYNPCVLGGFLFVCIGTAWEAKESLGGAKFQQAVYLREGVSRCIGEEKAYA